MRIEPPLVLWPTAGVYQLQVRVYRDLRLKVGRLGFCTIPAGQYVYTGRASRALRARVQRHLRGTKRTHWHIDYLLASRHCRIECVRLAHRNPEAECAVNRSAAAHGTLPPVPRFGASDCRASCVSHLVRLAGGGGNE